MTFDQIQSFYWVAMLGTYQLAAEKQNTTQPAISARIKSLERTLGVILFDRTGRRVALTPHGRQFLKHAETLMEIRGQALRDIGQKDGVTGTIRIGASDTVAVTWFPDFMRHLAKRYPEAFFETHVQVSYRLHEALIQRQLDIAFMVDAGTYVDLNMHRLFAYPTGFVVSPRIDLPTDRVFDIDDVAGMTLFTFDRLTRPYQDLRRALAKSRASALRISPTNTLQAIVLLVEKGLGVGYLPISAVERELALGQLLQIRTDFPMPDTSFCIAYPTVPGSTAALQIAQDAQQFLRSYSGVRAIKLFC